MADCQPKMESFVFAARTTSLSRSWCADSPPVDVCHRLPGIQSQLDTDNCCFQGTSQGAARCLGGYQHKGRIMNSFKKQPITCSNAAETCSTTSFSASPSEISRCMSARPNVYPPNVEPSAKLPTLCKLPAPSSCAAEYVLLLSSSS